MGATVWNESYGCYTAKCWNKGSETMKSKKVSIKLNECIIEENEFMFYDLVFKGKKVKRLTFEQFLEYKKFVKEVKYYDKRSTSNSIRKVI